MADGGNCDVLQDQKQTDSIQVLQSQLENVTRLMLNLTTTVGQLQREVGYLLSTDVLATGYIVSKNNFRLPICNSSDIIMSVYHFSFKSCN